MATEQTYTDDTSAHQPPIAQNAQPITTLLVNKDTPIVLDLVGSHQPTFVARTGKQKLLAKFGFGSRHDIPLDMDVGCGCYDEQGKLLDVVWYGKVRAFDGAVRLPYDTFIGMNKKYTPTSVQEHCSVRLFHLPQNVQTLVLFVHCHGNYPLKQLTVGELCLKVSDHHTIHEMTLANCADDVAGMAVWQVSRVDAESWQVWAINEPVAGDTIGKMATHWQIKKH